MSPRAPQYVQSDRESRERKQDRLREVYQAGADTAKSHKIGDVFLGAWGEVDRLGYIDIDERVAFIEGYLGSMPTIFFDTDNKITGIVNRE